VIHTNVLLTVAKRPQPGQTKTRLTPPLTPDQAAALYECFLQDTLDLMGRVPEVDPVIAFLPPTERAYFATLAPTFGLIEQQGDDLGARLDNALTHFLHQGYQAAVIMDSDSPTLPAETLTAAFDALAGDADVVLGPCDDGGYYLIGLKRPAPRLLREVRMSTPRVTADTLTLAAAEGLRVAQLPTWYDIDDGAALGRLLRELTTLPNHQAPHTRRFFAENAALVQAL
jgi:hypothetical protein